MPGAHESFLATPGISEMMGIVARSHGGNGGSAFILKGSTDLQEKTIIIIIRVPGYRVVPEES